MSEREREREREGEREGERERDLQEFPHNIIYRAVVQNKLKTSYYSIFTCVLIPVCYG